MDIFHYCFDHGALVRYTGDIIALGPATVATESQLEELVELVRRGIRAVK
jgi:beta-alanine--pyruvate transaminase